MLGIAVLLGSIGGTVFDDVEQYDTHIRGDERIMKTG